ncbi:MT-A70 family methyltransferase [Phyllobacterium sp. UNC302MFCol5.2]|uniref:MT-A70 family methyltransferase n=1 Tax=Phyllobacterium sp. UNC302MFCol5.2 TaxID=1449065 RepID=UPI001FD9F71B|nr:MT-A70 family methyltransferase [Phyllobacterium sp. UNC302MFCol5.2]
MIVNQDLFALLPYGIQAEISENLFRKNWLPSEIDELRQLCEATLGAFRNARTGIFPPAIRTQIGEICGTSWRNLDKIKGVCEAARNEPERFRHLLAEMDRTGRFDPAFKQLGIARAREDYAARKECGGTVDDLAALAGTGYRARVIYADPPWPFEVYSGKGKQRSADRHYDTQSLASIMALGPTVKNLAANDCALFLWAVSPELRGAHKVIESWGFTYKTVGFVWVKTTQEGEPATGMGYWTRSNVEHCLLATRGSPSRQDKGVAQVLMAPRGEHSAKPEEVASRIERLVNGPYIELYARSRRAGWQVWGDEVPLVKGTH